jgi:hypothetical protein
MKILITGSRDFTNEAEIATQFATILDPTVIVHGACPTGADNIADNIACAHPMVGPGRIHRYPAAWARFGRRAGPMRNQKMIDFEKPDVAWAFYSTPHPEVTSGTADCVERARSAGITVVEFWPEVLDA